MIEEFGLRVKIEKLSTVFESLKVVHNEISKKNLMNQLYNQIKFTEQK